LFVSIELELISLLRQQHKSHMALMRAVLALSTAVNYLTINADAAAPATPEDKEKWRALRAEFNEQIQLAIAAFVDSPS
jgi:hypothetical protein